MTLRTSRRLLWLASLLAFPVPYLMLGPGLEPPARFAMLAGITLAVALVENAQGAVPQLLFVFLAQALLAAALLWISAHLVARALGALGERGRSRATWCLLALGLALACAFPIYETPYAAHAPRASLLRVYE